MDNFFDAPCKFCGYNGVRYWQKGTHYKGCPFRNIGGIKDRRGIMEVLAKIYNNRNKGDGEPYTQLSKAILRHKRTPYDT